MEPKKNFSCLFVTLIAMILAAAFPDAARSAGAMFHSVNDTYGISAREVYSISKDEEGFVWAASKTGIFRISGDDAKMYTLPLATTDRYLTKLVYQYSRLVAYTNNGQIFLYNELYDRFDLHVDLRQALGDPFINATGLVIGYDDTMWLATSSGLYVCNGQTPTRAYHTPVSISQLIPYGDQGQLIVATSQGIAIFDTAGFSLDYLHRFPSGSRIQVSSLLCDPGSGTLWVGTLSHGLFACNVEDRTMRPVLAGELPPQPILALRKHGGSLLTGIDGQGIWELSADGESVLNVYREDENNPHSLRGDGVYDIFCDGDERIWVGTFSGGLSWYHTRSTQMNLIDHQINDPYSLVNNNVNRVLEDSRGDLWFATNNGLSRRSRATSRWDSWFHDNSAGAKVFLALCEDDDGNIWAGTYSSGVYVIDGDTGRQIAHYFYAPDRGNFSAQFIADIFKDRDGNLWLGGTRNILCWLKDEQRFEIYDSQSINSFEEYSSQTMLLGCAWGLLALNKRNGRIDVLINNCRVQDMVVIGNRIWVATSGDGLLCLDRKHNTVERLSTETGILDAYINSITWAGGYLWLGTESGLCRFDIETGTAMAYPSIFTTSRESYNTNAQVDTSDGKIIWGTNRGAVITDPYTQHEMEDAEGRIFMQDITVAGLSIRENEALLGGIPVNRQRSLLLNHRQNNLSFELLPMGTYARDTKFSWKMEGLDERWSTPSERKFAVYNGLPSGKYRFEVAMYDGWLSRIIDERSVDVEIFPPFWATWWFRLVVMLAAVGIAAFWVIWWTSRMRQLHLRDKLKFFTRMAHDIRTHLTLISAPVEQINSSHDLPQGLKYFSDLAVEQSVKLSFVATQLLDFEKMDLGKEQLLLAMTDVVELLAGRIQLFGEAAKKHGITIDFTPGTESFVTAVDQIKIEKTVDNLISNALKYSHPSGRIEIRLDANDRSWTLEVKDYGLGISEADQKNLFREFYRADNAVNSRIAGSGIGLLLVKRYVDMHNGRIELLSKENAGSTFRITLPFRRVEGAASAPAKPAAAPAFPVAPHAGIPVPFPVPAPAPEENGGARSPRTHILVVEDNDQLREFLKNALRRSYHVTVAADGAQAWEAVEKKMPDLIISDIMMPNMDGFELCRLVKSTFLTAHIPVMLLTSLSEQTKQLEGLGLGADDYITKPFDITVLSRRIASILQNRDFVRKRTLQVMSAADNGDHNVFANEMNDQFIKKAIEAVRANIANTGFHKDDFASVMHVSRSLLYQKIKALTGNSPAEFIKSIRLNHASELLRTGRYSVAEVSEMCGFTSANYFGTAFKKYFGHTPISVSAPNRESK